MTTGKVLSIVIPVWNKFNFTKSCLSDLYKLSNDHEIIVIDNASTDETQSELEKSDNIIYHRNKENLGFAKACNIGYALASAPNILFLNNDIRVKSNFEDWTAPIIKECPNGLVGPTMGQLDNNLNFVQEANKLLTGNSYMSGWCLGASREIWSKLHFPRKDSYIKDTMVPQIFSEEFGLAYFEDTDLGFRARQLKIPSIIVDIPVVHFGQQTSKQLNTHALYSKARQIFINKWGRK
jgi:GT2 family glycosyltransferase